MVWVNAGSGLEANGIAVNAFLVTNTSAATAMVTWLVLGMIHTGKSSSVSAATGAIAGLATITPAAGFVGVQTALLLGFASGIITFYVVFYKEKINLDDALDVFAVHGVGGIIGILGTGIFADKSGAIGIIEGSSDLFIDNLVMIAATVGYSFLVTYVVLKVLDKIPGLGLRSSEADEDQGLDVSDHGETAYISDGADTA